MALARDGIVLSEAVEQTGGRSTNAFALIEKVLADAKISREQIEAIAVGLGPGSYTGIRAAIAVAQGWRLAFAEAEPSGNQQTMTTAQRRLAREIRLLGVGSVEAVVARAQAEKIFGRVNVVLDAQRGEFYLATWEIGATGRREISPLKIVPAAEVEVRKAAGEICLGPEQGRQFFPEAAEIALLAGGKNVPADEFLEPVYLRAASFVKAPPSREL